MILVGRTEDGEISFGDRQQRRQVVKEKVSIRISMASRGPVEPGRDRLSGRSGIDKRWSHDLSGLR
jgi:hypothetical protein